MAEENPHRSQEGELRYPEAQVVAFKRDFIENLHLFQIILKQEHIMSFNVSVLRSKLGTLGKALIKGHDINIPKMPRATKWHLKILSSQRRRGSTPKSAEETRNTENSEM